MHPGNEPAGAFPGRMRRTTPRKHAWVRGTPRLAKGCPAPGQASGQPPRAPRRMDASRKPPTQKCSLGLQVNVIAELGLFCPALPSCFCSRRSAGAAPILVAQDFGYSREAADSTEAEPAVQSRQPRELQRFYRETRRRPAARSQVEDPLAGNKQRKDASGRGRPPPRVRREPCHGLIRVGTREVPQELPQ